jgi:hypothetical protein
MTNIIYISSPLTKNGASAFIKAWLETNEEPPKAIIREYPNGAKGMRKSIIFVKVIPSDKIALQRTHQVEESEIKDVI